MSQAIISSQTIAKTGRYSITTNRRSDTDILSIYVNRVRKVSTETGPIAGISDIKLEEGDVIESTGELTITPVQLLYAMGSKDTDLVPAGTPLRCHYYRPDDQGPIEHPEGGGLSKTLPWCIRFQLNPKCNNDLEHCDVGWNRPDPRDGYR